jgi:hypothetical protein
LKDRRLQTKRAIPRPKKIQVKVLLFVITKRYMSAPSMPRDERNMLKFSITKIMKMHALPA